MADPFSIATGIIGLIAAIGTTYTVFADIAKTCRNARDDLVEVTEELSKLKQALEQLKDDTDADVSVIPKTQTAQILDIISGCNHAMDRMHETIQKHSGKFGPCKWASSGKNEMIALRGKLASFQGTLCLTLAINGDLLNHR